ncbi:MAG: RNA-binding S4 domain-containing protein [Clostridia bacterium]|jgi:ribosomal 50S subunit-recycling heat shock protein|nr:RNA-binding S4 domain-containing protein [Clostridia bacterium]
MRLDKFMKVSRLIKRRTVAKDVSEAGRISVNGKVAKPSTEVKAGDILKIGFGAKEIQVEILEIKETIAANDAKNLYRVIE